MDVRTRYEYQDIGHPAGAFNIPWLFYTTNAGEKGYLKVPNKNFCRDLKAKFNPRADTLLLLCRSAQRTVPAATAAVDCGFSEDRVFNVLGGFEGDKVKDKASPFAGKRMIGGWRLEGLPWTYKYGPEAHVPARHQEIAFGCPARLSPGRAVLPVPEIFY